MATCVMVFQKNDGACLVCGVQLLKELKFSPLEVITDVEFQQLEGIQSQ